jgi:uncharacterized integral membrane protein
MKTFKVVLPLLLVTLSVGAFAFVAKAADVPSSSRDIQLAQTDDAPIPQIYVYDTKLDKTSYNSGDTIKGSFTVKNSSNSNASGLLYETILVGKFNADGIPAKNYGLVTSDVPFLSPKEQTTIHFTYKLPDGFGGKDVALFIRTKLASGFHLGEEVSSHFNILGGNAWLDVLYSAMGTGKEGYTESEYNYYSLHAGPTIYSNKAPSQAIISFTIKNENPDAVTVVPTLTIYKNDLSGEKIYQSELKDRMLKVLPGKDTGNTIIALPDFKYTPGIYAGLLSFKDDKGMERSSRIDFRYIVAGDVYTIHSVSADKTTLQANDPFVVTMSYSGTPIDMYSTYAPTEASQPAKVTVAVFNERDEKIAEGTEPVDFAKGTSHNFSFLSSGNAEALRGEVSITTTDGKLISNKSFILSPDYEAKHGAPKKEDFAHEMYIAWIVGGVLVLLLLIFIIKKGLHRNNVFLMIFILACLCGVAAILYPFAVKAFTLLPSDTKSGLIDNTVDSYGWNPQVIYVSAPMDDAVFAPGAPFSIVGHANYWACTNASYDTSISVYNYNDSGTAIVKIGAQSKSQPMLDYYHHWEHADYSFDDYFSYSTKAPVTPGDYKFLIRSTNHSSYENMVSVRTGFQNYKVPGVGETSGKGCIPGQYFCELFKLCIPYSEACNAANPNYTPSEINDNIPAAQGPVRLKTISPNIPIGNPGYSCTISWTSSFASYDKDTHCTFTGGPTPISFDPSSSTAPTSFTSPALNKDTTYTMSCHEGSNGTVLKAETACRINWNYKEVN